MAIRMKLRRIALCVAGSALCALPCACAAPRTTASKPTAPVLAPNATLDPSTAAARAVAISPRVLAAAHRLDASAARAQAAALPPDPTIAISLGVPIDGLGGFPISLSIMEGLAWLMHADVITSSAERERAAASAELLAASVEVAADARRLVRAVAAAREQTAAADRAVQSRAELVEIERSALALGESSTVRIAALESRLTQARLDASAAQLMNHELETALASLLAVERAPAVSGMIPDDTALGTADSLDVLRARARVARAESMLAASGGVLGANSAIGPSISRDLEDRESLGGTLEFTAPLFRRGHELAALESDLAAEREELAEAERRAALDLDHARAQVESARSTLAIALDGARTTEAARAALAAAADDGEASRAAIAEASADAAEWRARAAERRIELANALFRIESRAATSERSTEAAITATTEGTNR